MITRAIIDHIDAIKALADANRNDLGFILRMQIQEAVEQNRTLVAIVDKQVVGFVIYRHRKNDLQTTLAEICVAKNYRGQGIGTGLMDALVSESTLKSRLFIQLKCPENLPANDFYSKYGFCLSSVEPGKSRRLNIWRFQVSPLGE